MTGPGLVIVWHSRTGAARAMAAAAAEAAITAARDDGTSDPDKRVSMVEASEANAECLLAASGFLFVCPENLGSMSGIMKDMFDRTYYPLLGQVEGRPYATAIAAGSDGHGAQAQIDRIVTGWRLRRVAEPLIICLEAQTPQAILAPKVVPQAGLGRCRELGAALMCGIGLGVF